MAEASPPTSIDSAGPSTGDETLFDILGFGVGFCFGVEDSLLCVSKQGTILTNLGLWPKASNASRVPGPRSADTATLQRTFSEKVLTTSWDLRLRLTTSLSAMLRSGASSPSLSMSSMCT